MGISGQILLLILAVLALYLLGYIIVKNLRFEAAHSLSARKIRRLEEFLALSILNEVGLEGGEAIRAIDVDSRVSANEHTGWRHFVRARINGQWRLFLKTKSFAGAPGLADARPHAKALAWKGKIPGHRVRSLQRRSCAGKPRRFLAQRPFAGNLSAR